MGRSLSRDLRDRVVTTVEGGAPCRRAAERFGVSAASAIRWRQRQRLYDTFGDKWGLYRSSVRRYGMGERAAHFEALRSGVRAIDGINVMLRRVVATACQPCLGVGSICEFGASRPELAEINASLAKTLRDAIADFLIAQIAGIRVAGRGGADHASLSGVADMALRALR